MPILSRPQLPENPTDKDRATYEQDYDNYLQSILSAEPRELSAENQKDLGRAIAGALPDIKARRA